MGPMFVDDKRYQAPTGEVIETDGPWAECVRFITQDGYSEYVSYETYHIDDEIYRLGASAPHWSETVEMKNLDTGHMEPVSVIVYPVSDGPDSIDDVSEYW